jgi:hypothetical protein
MKNCGNNFKNVWVCNGIAAQLESDLRGMDDGDDEE